MSSTNVFQAFYPWKVLSFDFIIPQPGTEAPKEWFIHLMASVFLPGSVRTIIWPPFLNYCFAQWEQTGLSVLPAQPASAFSALQVWCEGTKRWWGGVHLLPFRGAQLGRKAGKSCSWSHKILPSRLQLWQAKQSFPATLRCPCLHSLRIEMLTLIKSGGGGWQNYPQMAGAQMH